MTKNYQIIRFLRSHIPAFACEPGCHDCCGPVTASSEEIAGLPVKSEAEHTDALADWRCPYLGEHGCTVYAERPLICRVFGTTPRWLALGVESLRCCLPPKLSGRYGSFCGKPGKCCCDQYCRFQVELEICNIER